MFSTFGLLEPNNDLQIAYFGCVIALYFLSFFMITPYMVDNLLAGQTKRCGFPRKVHTHTSNYLYSGCPKIDGLSLKMGLFSDDNC